MALFDFLKRKKEVEKAKKKAPDKKAEGVLKAKPARSVVGGEENENKPKASKAFQSEKSGSFSFAVLKAPHISEKASLLAEKNQYVFKVFKETNKQEIKKAIEGTYGVNVVSVNVLKSRPKKRRLGRIEGWKKGYKKAIVTVKEGQKIEVI